MNLLRVHTPGTTCAAELAGLAVAALVDEAMLTPKPGLVDMRGSGAHRDLSWLLMCHSAHALRPAFEAMAHAGATIDDLPTLRRRIGAIGRTAEATMMAATGGVNTHRGAIWALGLLVTAAGQATRDGATPAAIAARAGALARLTDPGAPACTGNKGETARKAYCVGGARGQAEAAFPHVTAVALPMLHASRRRGDSESAARLNALLAIVADLDDTCLLARGGPPALAAAQAGAQAVLDAGGAATAAGQAALQRLEADMLARGTSPGGAADLLAAALLLDSIGIGIEQSQTSQASQTMEGHHGATAI
ncbi:MAG TPA: triphosphoribosyl-dephospho-CoA synthase [Pseudoduganella sp.]